MKALFSKFVNSRGFRFSTLIGLLLAGIVYYEIQMDHVVTIPEDDSEVVHKEIKVMDPSKVKLPKIVLGNENKIKSVIYEVTFPDGSVLPVNMRSWSDIDQHSQQADGDAKAAFSHAVTLAKCRIFGYSSEEKLRDSISILETEHRWTQANGKVFEVSNDDVDSIKDQMNSGTKQCKGIGPEQLAKADEFMEQAYELGSVFAINKVAMSLPLGEKKRLAFEKAWLIGDPAAIGWVGDAYSNKDWSGEGVDKVKAYAYTYLADELIRISFTDVDGNVDPFFYRISTREWLDDHSSELTHAEFGEAMELAKLTLIANPNCCMSSKVPSSPGE